MHSPHPPIPARPHLNASRPLTLVEPDYTREVYSVQGERVTLDPQHGWQCSCMPYVEQALCAHVREAQTFREMRNAKPDEDTIEMVLSASQLQALTQAATVAEPYRTQAQREAHRDASPRAPRQQPSSWRAVVAAAALAAMSSSGITYLATSRAEQASPVEQPLPEIVVTPPALVAAQPAEQPVKFVNPFDRSEVFEFPAGTSQSDARDAVAQYLLARARNRMGIVVDPARDASDTVFLDELENTMSLAHHH